MSEPVTTDAPATRRNAKRNKWAAIGALGVAAIAFLLITVSGIGDNLVYYWTPSDLEANRDKAVGATIRLGGMVKPGSIVGGQNGSALEFDVTDYKSSVHVRSTGVPPQMFREEIGVVVEGTMTEAGYFECNRLMVSHGNEYRAPEGSEHPDVKKLMESTEGLD